jgi:anti-sigma regulatory factor (Ser/Thr protein kinase)
MSRDAAAEPAVYLSTLKALLDAASGAAEERAQGIAEAVVQELTVETCSVALRRRGEPQARLVGHARRWDAGTPALDETQALALAWLAGGEDDRLYFVRRNGVFVPSRATELAGEACVVLPVDAGAGASATLVVHAEDAVAGLVPHFRALGLVAQVMGLVLAARDEDPPPRAADWPTRAVSHRLRNPLNAILGFSGLVRDGSAGVVNEEQAHLLDRVLANSQQLNVVIDDLLFFVEIEAGRVAVRPESVDVRALVDEVIAALGRSPDGGPVAFRLEMAVGADTIVTDRGVLRRLVFHLLSNAFRYTAKGEVTVGVRMESPEMVVVVRDTGSGIPAERAQRLEDPAADSPGAPERGLGMGLSLIRRCVRLLGGTVTVKSEPDRGSEFTVRLPATLAPRPASRASGTLH